jgi:hypothetical protein
MELKEQIRYRYETIAPLLNERQQRLWAAIEAKIFGYGGISMIHRATGISRSTIIAGLKELALSEEQHLDPQRVRRQGGGRKCLEIKDPTISQTLQQQLVSATLGDPQSGVRWTTKSTRNLATTLCGLGHTISHQSVATRMRKMSYSLQGNKKNIEGRKHPDRNAQYEYIHQLSGEFTKCDQPSISVDAKKRVDR